MAEIYLLGLGFSRFLSSSQSGVFCPIFAQHCVYLTLFQGEVDAIVGENTGESLCYAAQLKYWCHGYLEYYNI